MNNKSVTHLGKGKRCPHRCRFRCTHQTNTTDSGDLSMDNTSIDLLTNVLQNYNITSSIASYSHFPDVAHLAQTSRTLYSTLKPMFPDIVRLCRCTNPSGKMHAECWGCGIPLCRECCSFDQPAVRQPRCEGHAGFCSPRCRKCYKRGYAPYWIPHGDSHFVAVQRPKCDCIDMRTPQLLSDWNQTVELKVAPRTLCGGCASLHDASREGPVYTMRRERMARRLKQEDAEISTCAGCDGVMGTDPTCWVCKLCAKECTMEEHTRRGPRRSLLAWVKAKFEKRVEVDDVADDTAPRGE